MSNVFTLTTDSITISAQPEYMDHESSPANAQYVWVYHIKIRNNGKSAVQIINRYWHITDGKGIVQEVNGQGVVGLQPIIMPDETFDYTSSVSLNTPTGIMHGSYEAKSDDGMIFHLTIPVFSLDSTEQLRRPN